MPKVYAEALNASFFKPWIRLACLPFPSKLSYYLVSYPGVSFSCNFMAFRVEFFFFFLSRMLACLVKVSTVFHAVQANDRYRSRNE